VSGKGIGAEDVATSVTASFMEISTRLMRGSRPQTYSKDVGFLGQGLIPQESRPLQLGQSRRARS
jgi:hypothetical protein